MDYQGTVEYAPGKDGVGKAVHTKATTVQEKEVEKEDGTKEKVREIKESGYGLRLKEENIGSTYTVSAWVKPDNANAFHANGPVMILGHSDNTKEKWMGISGNNAGENSKARVWGNIPAGRFDNAQTQTEFTAAEKQWMMLTITQLQNTVNFYLNGELKNSFNIRALTLA